MPRDDEQQNIPGIESEALNPAFIAQIASRLFNEAPEAASVPRYETDAVGALPAASEHDFYFLPGTPEKKQEPLGHQDDKLNEQQN